MTLVSAMQHCYGVVPEAFGRCFASSQAEASSDDSGGEDAALGVPRDQTKQWRKLARKRQRKAAYFLQDQESCFLTMLWGVVTFCVMTVHYSLFKRGTWLSERVEEEAERKITFFFSNPAASPAARASSEIASLLGSVQVDDWIPLVGLYGPVLSWPQRRLRTTRRCLLTEVGQLYRKLLEPWQRYPWKLVALTMMEEPMRTQAAQDFFQVRDCCLDGFSRKLKTVVEDPDGLLAPNTLKFLASVFDRLVPTSTCIERAFARLSRWCDRRGPKPQLCTLAAKNAVYHFRYLTDHWRAKARKLGVIRKGKSQRCRPDWAHGVRKGRGFNGVHMFARHNGLNPSDDLLRQWRMQPRAERRRFAALARAANLEARVVQRCNARAAKESAAVTGGFWNMSAATGFPMAKPIVAEHLDSLKDYARNFRMPTQSLQPESPDSFTGAPAMPFSVWASCQVGACPHQLTHHQQECFRSLHEMLLLVIGSQSPDPAVTSKEPLVLEFRSQIAAASRQVVVAYNTRKKPIEAALITLRPLPPVEVPPEFLQVLACEKGVDGQFPLVGDVAMCVELAGQAADWELFILSIGAITDLHLFHVPAAQRVDFAALMLEVGSNRETKRVLDALKRLDKKATAASGSNRKTDGQPRRQSKGRGKGRGAKGKAETADAPDMPGDQDDALDGGGSSQSDEESVADVEDVEVDWPLDPPPCPPEASVAPRRRNVRRGQVWGSSPAFQIAPIHAAGSVEPTGFGAICGMHRDPANPTLQCKKAMPCGGLSPDECKLRLKRWLVAGLESGKWGVNKRESHVSMGGVQLSHFAEGLSLEDLDRAVSHGE